MESIAIVKRRGCDFWPCISVLAGSVCRVGGRLHSMGPLQKGSQREGEWWPCERELVTCIICRHRFEAHEVTNMHACSYECFACAEETERILFDDEWWAKNGPRGPEEDL